ncbi:MAG: metallophosphoesterase [Caldimonas sp.]
MRLHVLSDLHLEHADFTVPSVESDVLVLAGDLRSPGRSAVAWAAGQEVGQGRPVVMVPGNHEFYDARYPSECDAMRIEAATSGVHLLDRGTVVIGAVRFIGCTLWTDFELPIETPQGPVSDRASGLASCAQRLADYRLIRFGDEAADRLLQPEDTLLAHQAERAWLWHALSVPFDGRTVVVTHHAPHRRSLAPRFEADRVSAGFVSALPDAFFSVPVLWIHGHTHTRFDYTVGNCRVVCNPRGYPRRDGRFEVDGFDAGFTVEV